jgi:hypothetical protein
MSYQLSFLGYYLIKSQQLKKQTHSLKRRNFHHRERMAQVDGQRRRMASVGRWLRNTSRGWGSHPPSSAGHPFRRLEGGRSLRPLVAPADGLAVCLADGHQGGCPWGRRTRDNPGPFFFGNKNADRGCGIPVGTGISFPHFWTPMSNGKMIAFLRFFFVW